MVTLSWQQRGACLELTHLFYDHEQEEVAKRICRRCPVQAACLDYALDNGETSGVWGGATEDERRRMLRSARPGGEAPSDVTYTTNARSTGARCSAGRSPAGGWSVVCRTHESTAVAVSRTTAEFAVSRPEEWCPTCALIAAGELPKPVSKRPASQRTTL